MKELKTKFENNEKSLVETLILVDQLKENDEKSKKSKKEIEKVSRVKCNKVVHIYDHAEVYSLQPPTKFHDILRH